MKAIILAGGAGDRLWPLSRKNAPKQFLNLNQDNSLFQETIIRNIPFCDEFVIVTNQEYQEIVEGQMNQFQGISYQIIVETEALGTAPAVLKASSVLSKEEMVLIMPADLVLIGEGYSDALYQAKTLAEQGQYVLFGVRADAPKTGYGYIRHQGNHVSRFIEKPSKALAQQLFYQDDILWNSGMILCNNGMLQEELEDILRIRQEKYEKEHESPSGVYKTGRIHIEKALLETSDHLSVVPLFMQWQDVSNFHSYESVSVGKEHKNTILRDCKNTTVINQTDRQLIVGNDLDDLFVVNTEDAIYITRKESEQDIKSIIAEAPDTYEAYFNYSPMVYRNWGMREIIAQAPGYRVRRILMYPGATLSAHSHEKRNENYAVIQGQLAIELDGRVIHIWEHESINILPNQMHRLFNDGDQNVVVIEVDTGQEIDERDMIHLDEVPMAGQKLPELYLLSPAYKDYLWGGDRLVRQFGKQSPYDITAESWELSAHKDGQSHIVGGTFDDQPFGDFIRQYGSKVCGWKSRTFDRFPILIKFIDAAKPLSVQIHPGDDYAFVHEKEFGKNEMWYVMDAVEGAYLYCGFSRRVSEEEVRKRLADNSITEVLNKVYVKKGDVIFIPAGTIHAIGAGILICEIQQNSNSTYRVYDYDRVDKEGKKRPLHVDKALDVMNFEPYEQGAFGLLEPQEKDGNVVQQLSLCKYFQCEKYRIREKQTLYVDEASFVSLVILAGNGIISCGEESISFGAGDSIFVSAGRKVLHIEGTCELITTRI